MIARALAGAPPGRKAAAGSRIDEQFDDPRQQRDAVTLGVWIFLATETLFFGALFFAYLIARIHLPDAFAAASRHTNIVLGTLNTAVLLTSSFCVAQAAEATRGGTRRIATMWLAATALLGLVFTAIKLTEYGLEYHEHLVPLLGFAFEPQHALGAHVFFGFYFAMTGLHLVHLTIGVAIIALFAWRVARTARHALSSQVEMAALYWHFVDIVWIFLYPCLYLVSRS